MKFLPTLAAALLLAPLATAQTNHTFNIVKGQSQFHFGGSTSLGNIEGRPNNFRLEGTMDAELTQDPVTNLFSSGEILSAVLTTDPTTLHAVVPNPVWFLPDLADIYIRDAVFTVTSDPFTVDASGNFSTLIVLQATGGEVETIPLVGSPTLTDLSTADPSDPTPVTGTVSDDGTNVVFTLDMDVTFAFDDGAGMTADIWVNGTAVGAHPSGGSSNPTLAVSNLIAGQTATFAVTNASPSSPSFLAYSTTGTGSTFVSQLGVTLGLARPTQAGPSLTSDAAGSVTWNLPIPGNASGVSVWFQACQMAVITNVAAEVVQ